MVAGSHLCVGCSVDIEWWLAVTFVLDVLLILSGGSHLCVGCSVDAE